MATKDGDEFITYSKRGQMASGKTEQEVEARSINDGWVIYKKTNDTIEYSTVSINDYEENEDYMPKAKAFTFSKLLGLIHL